MAIAVNQSKAKCFRTCRQQYQYRYVEGLVKKKTKRPFMFGKIVHSMIEAYANGDDPFEVLNEQEKKYDNLFRAEQEMYGPIVEDLRYIMSEYFDYWSDDSLTYWRHQGRSSEHYFEIELEPGLVMKGTIDAVGRSPKSKMLRWLVEHKTFRVLPDEDFRWRNVQGAVYIRAIDMLGWKPVDGIMWDYVRSKSPSRPQLLKDGSLSKRAIDSLPSVVEDTLRQLKLPVGDYHEYINSVREKRSAYFLRIYTPASRQVIDKVFEDFVCTAREIQEAHGHMRPVRNIGQHCGWCDYEGLCRAALQGSDEDFVKEREYKVDAEEVENTAQHLGE
jgi:hypothetical protein